MRYIADTCGDAFMEWSLHTFKNYKKLYNSDESSKVKSRRQINMSELNFSVRYEMLF